MTKGLTPVERARNFALENVISQRCCVSTATIIFKHDFQPTALHLDTQVKWFEGKPNQTFTDLSKWFEGTSEMTTLHVGTFFTM